MLDRYEIQINSAGKWISHGVVDGDETTARKTWDYLRGTVTHKARLVTHDYKGRIRVIATQGVRAGYRVTYGETMPMWSRVLPTLEAATAFADKHRGFGDTIFNIEATR